MPRSRGQAASSGSRTLKDAVNEALRDWVATVEGTHYCLGSAMGPHPYPYMVRELHRVIGDEAREQCRAITGGDPDLVVACVGGGSNAIGIFSGFAELPDIALATESLRGFAREPHFERASGRDDGQWLVGTVEELSTVDAGKILVWHPQLHTEELTVLVEEVVGDRAEVSHSGAIRMTEIVPAGVTKALALEHWCEEQAPQVAAEAVWAFGDMPNDLPMLTWAGLAHAVANAHPDVLAVADHVIPGNDDDGVARTLAARLLG